ncbi:DUF308 domain-containing protein [Cellulomonas sp. DKR-3]|uniref:DUF308 domain-containing protein n=1 Tax=Cellulomonas fulva TaxID=2835530 RepID=A0ABS5TWQ4_9CELL|nr:DUF308 domain-containing protein [Cellulomonas fulva]MBT0993585.1 DUF308 domain-containing protein [Cellulomonas fulva]
MTTIDETGRELRALWWLPVLRGVVLLLLGLLMLFHPLETLAAITWVFGVFAVLDGVLILLQAFVDRAKGVMWWQVLGGLIVIGLGVVVMVWPKPTVLVLFYLVAAWILAVGLFGLVGSVVLHKRAEQTWFVALAFGLVNLVIGLLLVLNPQTSLSVVMILTGVFALVGGVLLLVSGLAARSLGKQLAP